MKKILGAMAFVVSCGAGPRVKEESNYRPIDSTEAYKLDTAALVEMDRVYTAQGSSSAWDMSVLVNGESRLQAKEESIQQVAQRLETIELRLNDNVNISVTVRSGTTILATNDPLVASSQPELSEFWLDHCSAIGQTVSVIRFASTSTESGTIKLEICDFAGFSLKPILQIAPQKKSLETKTVIYDCSFDPHTFSNGSTKQIGAYIGEIPCKYGYESLPGEQEPTIEILAEFAEGTPLFNEKLLRMDEVYLKIGRAGQFVLDIDFKTPPFGSIEACPTTKVDVKFAREGQIVSQRLEFKRNNSAGQIWMPQNAESWPNLSDVIAYYQGSAAEKINIYMICEWIPEVQDLNAGKVISLSN